MLHPEHSRATRSGAERMAVALIALLFVGQSEARCLNRANTSVPESTPTANFTINADGTVTAPMTGLMWKRCLEGQTLSAGACTGAPTIYVWTDALAAARASTFAGHDDWRLPNAKELFSIVEDRCGAPALNADLFPLSAIYGVWSSTPTAIYNANYFADVWYMSLDGFVEVVSPNQEIHALLVRDLP